MRGHSEQMKAVAQSAGDGDRVQAGELIRGEVVVGLHSIPGILLFDIICCTKIPEFSKACALKTGLALMQRHEIGLLLH
jgi:hypothetical protein